LSAGPLNLSDITKFFGPEPVISNANLHITCGDRVGIACANGSGKSTLLKIMAGEVEHTSGCVSRGSNVTIHYYAQHQIDALSEELTVLEEMTSIPGSETIQTIRDVLGAFLFSLGR